jgi:hypothetical protein
LLSAITLILEAGQEAGDDVADADAGDVSGSLVGTFSSQALPTAPIRQSGCLTI